jgi:hypothetical protein
VESSGPTHRPDVEPSPGESKLSASFFSFFILVAMAFLVLGLAPTDLPPDKGSNFIGTIFHNKGVILAARLLLVSAAIVLAVGGLFIVNSIVVRMRNGEWLKRAGPTPGLGSVDRGTSKEIVCLRGGASQMTEFEDLNRRIEVELEKTRRMIERGSRRRERMWIEAERASMAGERARREIRRKLNIP